MRTHRNVLGRAEVRHLALLSLLLGSTASIPPPARAAELCGLDAAPGSTLFLPYFEVDFANPQGLTTLFSVVNQSDAPILTKATLWTDVGIPTLGFFIYLTGYDVTTVNLRDVFDGRLPQTASNYQDPTDTISPQGPLSQDGNFVNCTGILPPPLDFPPPHFSDLRQQHTGLPSVTQSGLCVARNHGDQRARGFLTLDTVSNCTLRSPKDPGYFAPGGLGDATDQNVLWGDFFYVDPVGNFSQGETLVRLQSFPNRFGAGSETFYGWLHGHSGKDGREPLPSQWTVRYLNGGVFDGGTDLLYWHEPDSAPTAFSCNQPPALLATDSISVTDEQENVEGYYCIGDPPFPGCGEPFHQTVTARAPVGGPQLPTPFDFGAFYIGHVTTTLPVVPPLPRRQSWLGALMSADGRFGVGLAGTPLNTGCTPSVCLPGSCFP
jgi:hypothetical protein